MTRRFFDAEAELKVAERRAAGLTAKQLAAEFGCSTRAIRTALERTGTPTSRPERKLTSADVQSIIDRYRDGATVKGLSQELCCRSDVITRVLAEHDVKVRFGGIHRRFTDAEAEAIAARRAEGASLTVLATEFDSNRKTVRLTLNRLGVSTEGKRPVYWTPERDQWLRDQYTAGVSQQKLADEVGCSQRVISVHLRRLGVIGRGPVARGAAHPHWKGGRRTTEGGYVHVIPADEDLQFCTLNSTGMVPEHRLVAGKLLGRKLLRSETVHHINGDKTDNRPENLQVRQGQHGNGVVFQCQQCGSHDISAVPLSG